MSGRRAKIIRKAAYLTWVEIHIWYSNLSVKAVYKQRKKAYTRGELK